MRTLSNTSWLDKAITEQLRVIADGYEITDPVELTQAKAMAKILNKALESWDQEEDFGIHASKVLLVLSRNPELRVKMGLTFPLR